MVTGETPTSGPLTASIVYVSFDLSLCMTSPAVTRCYNPFGDEEYTNARMARDLPSVCSGDNMLTALSVAYDSGLLPAGVPVVSVSVSESVSVSPAAGPPPLEYRLLERPGADDSPCHTGLQLTPELTSECRLAVTGPDWEVICRHHPELVPRLVVRGAVFARMRPEQKQQLVERVKELGYHVGECGD